MWRRCSYVEEELWQPEFFLHLNEPTNKTRWPSAHGGQHGNKQRRWHDATLSVEQPAALSEHWKEVCVSVCLCMRTLCAGESSVLTHSVLHVSGDFIFCTVVGGSRNVLVIICNHLDKQLLAGCVCFRQLCSQGGTLREGGQRQKGAFVFTITHQEFHWACYGNTGGSKSEHCSSYFLCICKHFKLTTFK